MESIKPIFKIGHGPSSSHTIGPGRAAAIFAGWDQVAAGFRGTLYGSLALTGRGHGTDQAIIKTLAGREVAVVWRPDMPVEYRQTGLGGLAGSCG